MFSILFIYLFLFLVYMQ